MGKSSHSKTKTSTAPWKVQTPYLKDAFSGAQDAYNAGKTPNANLTAGWSALANNATDPNSGLNTAKGYWGNVLSNGGYDDNVFKNIESSVLPAVNSQFMGSGRTGGGLQGIDLTKELTQSFSPFAIGQANLAAQNLPMLDAQGAQSLLSAGQGEYAYPWQNLNNYYGVVGGNNWGGTTTTKTPQPSTLAQIGGYIVGNMGQAASMLSGVPMGGGGGGSAFYNPTNIGGVY